MNADGVVTSMLRTFRFRDAQKRERHHRTFSPKPTWGKRLIDFAGADDSSDSS